nr:MAG TPA: hypothetical protein [Caudoviricetes sp.]
MAIFRLHSLDFPPQKYGSRQISHKPLIYCAKDLHVPKNKVMFAT